MRKSVKAKILVMAAAAVMCVGAVPATAAVPDSGVISPQNVAVSYNNAKISLDGDLVCVGETRVYAGYTASVTVELQVKDGGWKTLETWSNESESRTALVSETYSPTKGNTYRLYVTHKAYDSSGKCVETITKTSDTVTYS